MALDLGIRHEIESLAVALGFNKQLDEENIALAIELPYENCDGFATESKIAKGSILITYPCNTEPGVKPSYKTFKTAFEACEWIGLTKDQMMEYFPSHYETNITDTWIKDNINENSSGICS